MKIGSSETALLAAGNRQRRDAQIWAGVPSRRHRRCEGSATRQGAETISPSDP